jgi:mono/diheme cytochrome c family protein
VTRTRQVLVAVVLWALTAPSCLAAGMAEHDYVLHCAGCHGFDGNGSRDIPSLHGLAGLAEHPQWRAYIARVPGVANAPISDARLVALLDWILARFSPGTHVPPFSAREIAMLRQRPLIDPRAERARVVAALVGESAAPAAATSLVSKPRGD